MNKETERWIIIILLVMPLVAGLSGCAGNTKKAESTQPSVFDGSLSRMVGCIFAPESCKDMKQEEMSEEEMTEEFEKIAEQIEKENK